MKVVCDSCHARYQIPDERVAGRALRIRCRKCGGKIVVRGEANASAAAPESDAHAASGGDGGTEWYISEEGEQQGPLATQDLVQRLQSGALSWETFLWREGFDDWIPARSADELVNSAGPHKASPLPSAPPGEDEPTRMFNPAAVAPFSPTPSFRTAPGRRSAPPPRPAPQDSFAALSLDIDSHVPPGTAEENPATARSSEDAVLFSVSSLQNYGRAGGQDAAMPGHAGGEGSGIIDIKALAALASSPPSSASSAAGVPRESGVLSLGDLAHQSGSFAASSLSPPPKSSSSTGVVVAIVVGAAMVSAATFGAILLTRSSTPPAAPAAAATAPVAAPPAPPPAPVAVAPAPPPPAPPASAATHPPARTAEAKKPAPAPATEPGAKPPEPTSAEAAVAAATGTEEATTPNPYAANTPPVAAPAPKPPEPAKPRTMDDLLDEAVSGEPAPKADPMFVASGLPASPTREEVQRVMKGIEPEVRKCAQGGAVKGTAIVDVGVRGETGAVTRARVSGLTGPVGSCIALAVRQAKFEPFSKETFSITYPYKFE